MRCKSSYLFLQLLALMFFSTGTSMASDEKPDAPEKVSVGGYGFWQFGQIVQGWDRNAGKEISHYWYEQCSCRLDIKASQASIFN